MTYPRCPLQPVEVLELLRHCYPVAIIEHVVATELHQDGFPHLHAWIRYEKKVTFSTTRWDLRTADKVYHGNYAVCKSPEKCRQYCAKDGDYIASMDLKAKQKKKASRNAQLLSGNLKQLTDEGEIGLKELPQIEKARALYSLLTPPYQSENVRGVWITGKTGAGKSHYVRTKYEAHDLYLKGQTRWWCGYQSQQAVLIEDVDRLGATPEFGHLLKIWADKWGCSGEIKGGHASLHHRVIYVTSQYEIEDLWTDDSKLQDALKRRFTRIHLHRELEPEDIEEVENN